MAELGILKNYIDRDTLAAELRCSPRTISRYETQPNGLPSVIVAGRKLYPLDQVQSWLKARERRPNPRKGRAA